MMSVFSKIKNLGGEEMSKNKELNEIIDIISDVILNYISKRKEEKELLLAVETPIT